MKRFCQECGQEVKAEDHVCIHCGTKLIDLNQQEETPTEHTEEVEKQNSETRNESGSNEEEEKNNTTEVESNKTEGKRTEQRSTNHKKPMTKKQKLMIQIGAGVLVFLIGFSIWASNHHSAESVYNRFEKAIQEGDNKQISKLMIHEDGTRVSKEEAKAFLALIKEEGKHEVAPLYNVTRHGKFIGIFKSHKVEARDQFVSYDDMIEGLSFTFNDEEIAIYDEDQKIDYVLYGPLAPGIYTATAVFDGEYGETTKEEEIQLSSFDRDENWITMDIPVSKVTFFFENDDMFDPTSASILLNDEELDVSKDGETKEVGPFILDGSQTVQSVVEMPWGEITSEDIEVDSDYMGIYADLITEEQYDELTKAVLDFSEQFMEGVADKSTKPLENISDDFKETFDELIDYEFPSDFYFSGKLNSVSVDKDSLMVDTDKDNPVVTIDIGLNAETDAHYLEDDPDLNDETLQLIVEMNYNKDKKNWSFLTFEEGDYWGDFEGTDELEASENVYGPGEEAIAKAEEQGLEEEMEDFMIDYTDASVDAINNRDYSFVSDYITSDGPRKQESIDYIDYLDSKDIYEYFYGSELESMEEIESGKWEVTMLESFEIEHPDSSEDKEFRTTAVVVKDGDSFFVDELLETEEVD